MKLPILLAVLGALAVAAGVGWIHPPAGVIAAGVELVAAGYLTAYYSAGRRRE